MKIDYLKITNFKSIREMTLENIEDALILVGKNNTGKTVVLDAVRAITGQYGPGEDCFNDPSKKVTIDVGIFFTDEDIEKFYEQRAVSKYKKPPGMDQGILRTASVV